MNNFWADPIGFVILWFVNLLRGWGLPGDLVLLISYAVGALLLATSSLLLVIFLIWVERKIGGRVQDRLGPNRVGPFGIIQPIADMLKIFTKEYVTPDGADKFIYNLAPILSVGAVIMIWAVVPFAITLYGSNLNVGILYIVAVGGLSELGIILAGWGSNNKFALLGAFRAVAQLLSYEVPMIVSLLIPVMLTGSMNMNEIVRAQTVPFIIMAPIAALIFFISSLAENGRAPFDLLEAESEIVAGFNVEYSGLKFGFFFVGDFLHAFTIALLFSVIFLGGWSGPAADRIPILGLVYLMIKTSIVYFLGLLVRFSLPRFRIDQMMALNWKLLVPETCGCR
jgi:NADH-quinone oxidoreductase subunit H